MEGMEAVKFQGGRSERKRELEELIKAPHFNFIAVNMSQVPMYDPCKLICPKVKRERVEALRRKLSNGPSLTAPPPSIPGD